MLSMFFGVVLKSSSSYISFTHFSSSVLLGVLFNVVYLFINILVELL